MELLAQSRQEAVQTLEAALEEFKIVGPVLEELSEAGTCRARTEEEETQHAIKYHALVNSKLKQLCVIVMLC